MPDGIGGFSKRLLEPVERMAEILFGLIMVLSITGSVSVAEAGEGTIGTMLLAALGCNLAWGIIDGVLYVMACLAERGRGLATLLAVRNAGDPREAHRVIAGALPPLVARILQPEEFEAIRQRLRQLPEPVGPARLGKDDWLGFLAVFLLVFGSTFPVVIPFLFMRNTGRALRISHAIGVGMLFLTGYLFGRAAGRSPWVTGFLMVVLGALLVGLTVALGG
jgi:hypothetical protein